MAPRAKPASIRWTEILKKTVSEANEDDIAGRSAELSYYFILALFPLLICIISLLNVLFHAGQAIELDLIRVATAALPFSAAQLVQSTLTQVSQSHPETKLSFGLVLSFWWASAGMSAVMDALNSAYEVTETRSFLRRSAVALGLTVVVALLMMAGVGIVLAAGPTVGSVTNGREELLLRIVSWPVALGLVLIGFGLIYCYGPNVPCPHWHWITPGAIAGVAVWLIVSVALRIYLHFFNSYSSTYGALGAVIVLLLWFYLSGAALLAGAELNTVLEAAAAKAGDPQAREKGKPPPGASPPREPPRAEQKAGPEAGKPREERKTA